MKRRSFLFTLAASLSGRVRGRTAAGFSRQAPNSVLQTAVAVPVTANTHRPWVRWWWPGSAVDRAGLTQQLEELARVGVGGVEITPIYGARGYESRYLEFLSPPFMAMLEHAGREARRLGLGVDMA